MFERSLRVLLLVLPFGAAARYGALFDWMELRLAGYTALCLVVATFAVYSALFLLAFRSGPTGPLAAPVRRRSDWLLALGVVAIFCWSANRVLDDLPAMLVGEESVAIRTSELTIDAYRNGELLGFIDHLSKHYNIGLVPLVVPFVAIFGPNPWIYKWVNVGFFALVLGILALGFARTNAAPRERWTVLLMPIVAAILLSLQMYRWHCVCLAGCVAILLAASAWNCTATRFFSPLVVFCLVFTLYHGQLMYFPALLALAIWQILVPENGARRWTRIAGLIGCALVCLAAYLAFNRGAVFAEGNVAVKVAASVDLQFRESNLSDDAWRLLRAPSLLFSWPVWGFVLLGTAITIQRAERHPADRAALLLFGAGLTVHVLCHGIMNPTWHCWYLVPGLWLLLNGCAGLVQRCREILPVACLGSVLAAALLAFAAWRESQAYWELQLSHQLAGEPAPWNTWDQLDYVFRYLARMPVDGPPTLHLIPSATIPKEQGGFGHDAPFRQIDWRERAVEVREFDTPEELLRVVRAVRRGRLRFQRVVIYFGRQRPTGPWNPNVVMSALAALPCEFAVLPLPGPPLPERMSCYTITFEREH
jgi:hypothetical protein